MRTTLDVALAIGIVFVGATCFAQHEPDLKDSTHLAIHSDKAIYDLKREMLLGEASAWAQANTNNESILYQSRLALVTLITGFLAFLFERSRRGKQNSGYSLSKRVVGGLAILSFFMYWSDCYITELQLRVKLRVDTIVSTLNLLPSLTEAELLHVQNYPSLEQHDLLHKVAILFPPNFAQVVAYAPLIVMLSFLIFEVYKRK